MPALKYKVELNESERTHLKEIASRGETSARKVKRALVLLKADEGLIDRDIASGLLISASTVGRVRTQYVQEGLDSALIERPRPGQRRKLDGRQEAHLVAIACSDAPEGHTHWTLQLLADKVVQMGFAESISLETVRQTLKKTNSSRGRRRNGASRLEPRSCPRGPRGGVPTLAPTSRARHQANAERVLAFHSNLRGIGNRDVGNRPAVRK